MNQLNYERNNCCCYLFLFEIKESTSEFSVMLLLKYGLPIPENIGNVRKFPNEFFTFILLNVLKGL